MLDVDVASENRRVLGFYYYYSSSSSLLLCEQPENARSEIGKQHIARIYI